MNLGAQMGPMSITNLSPNWACQMGPIHCPKLLLSGSLPSYHLSLSPSLPLLVCALNLFVAVFMKPPYLINLRLCLTLHWPKFLLPGLGIYNYAHTRTHA